MRFERKAALAACFILLSGALAAGAAQGATAKRNFFTPPAQNAAHGAKPKPHADQTAFNCTGPVSQAVDVGDESLRSTTAVFGSTPGGGVGGQFDPNPLLDVFVDIPPGSCLDAHFSGLVGSALYGKSPLALFEVTVEAASPVFAPGTPLIGHFPTPYGIPSPAVALQAEQDVDEIGANFFIQAGDGPRQILPGHNRVVVWWAGGPPGSTGGAIGSAFVLKLYVRGQ
ncbi:MAG TPA: hypothetical protein VNU97_19110 [Rhizomicrobium sp.]|jgi:hypothetical protein|nr:hypothetical protein [Rhizomicrobium sp.]